MKSQLTGAKKKSKGKRQVDLFSIQDFEQQAEAILNKPRKKLKQSKYTYKRKSQRDNYNQLTPQQQQRLLLHDLEQSSNVLQSVNGNLPAGSKMFQRQKLIRKQDLNKSNGWRTTQQINQESTTGNMAMITEEDIQQDNFWNDQEEISKNQNKTHAQKIYKSDIVPRTKYRTTKRLRKKRRKIQSKSKPRTKRATLTNIKPRSTTNKMNLHTKKQKSMTNYGQMSRKFQESSQNRNQFDSTQGSSIYDFQSYQNQRSLKRQSNRNQKQIANIEKRLKNFFQVNLHQQLKKQSLNTNKNQSHSNFYMRKKKAMQINYPKIKKPDEAQKNKRYQNLLNKIDMQYNIEEAHWMLQDLQQQQQKVQYLERKRINKNKNLKVQFQKRFYS